MEIEGARVLLTGASGGLGQAIAKALHEQGADLLLTARRAEVLDRICSELGSRAEGLPADLADPADVEALPARAGRVDILVHNAGLPGTGLIQSWSPEQIDRVLGVNLRSGLVLTSALLPGMLERGRGHLVFVSSMSGKVPTPQASVYATTKYGLRGFVGALRDDLYKTPIGASGVFPGPIKGAGMWEEAGIDLPRWVPTRSPEDVGAAVVKAVHKNKAEIDVADPVQKLGGWMAAVMPGPAERIRRLFPVEALAERTAAAQIDKR